MVCVGESVGLLLIDVVDVDVGVKLIVFDIVIVIVFVGD